MNGRFIVLEGSDGSGKATQVKLLAERLRAVGYEVAIFDFPRYEEPSSHFVKSYLNGEYGPAQAINPYTASLFYALDRFAASEQISQAISDGKIVLSNRYTGSNMAHQGSKFSSEAEQRGFFVWADSLEFQLLGIPRPDLNIFLRMPAEVSQVLIDRKARRNYTDRARDEHEADLEHLRNSVTTFDLLCKLFPKDYQAIESTQDGQLLDVPTINDRIWEGIKPYLPADILQHKPQAKTVDLTEPPQTKIQVTMLRTKSVAAGADEQVAMAIKSVSLLGSRLLQKNQFQPLVMDLSRGKRQAPDYYTPHLGAKLQKDYTATMREIAANRQKILKRLEAYAKKRQKPVNSVVIAELLSPMAFLNAVTIRGKRANLAALLTDLGRSGLEEFQALAKNLITRLTAPSNLELDTAQRDGVLPQTHSPEQPPAILTAHQPRSEFDLLADFLFDSTEQSREETEAAVSEWDYQQKAASLKDFLTKIDQGNVSGLNNLSYTWDLVIDDPSLNYLAAARAVNVLNAQSPSPRYGYDVPHIIDASGLTDSFVEIYDRSLQLFSALQSAGYEKEARYAVLAGHKGRWQASTNYQQLELLHDIAASQGVLGGAKAAARMMLEKVSEVHPVVASSIAKKRPKAVLQKSAGPSRASRTAKINPKSRVSPTRRRRSVKKTR